MKNLIFIKNILFSIQTISFLLSFFSFLFLYKTISSLIAIIIIIIPLLLSLSSLLSTFKTRVLFVLHSDDKFLNYLFLITVLISYFLLFHNIYNFSSYVVILIISLISFFLGLIDFKFKKNLYHDKIFFSSIQSLSKSIVNEIIVYNSLDKNISYIDNHVLFYGNTIPLSVVFEFEKIYEKKLVDFSDLEIETLKMYSIS